MDFILTGGYTPAQMTTYTPPRTPRTPRTQQSQQSHDTRTDKEYLNDTVKKYILWKGMPFKQLMGVLAENSDGALVVTGYAILRDDDMVYTCRCPEGENMVMTEMLRLLDNGIRVDMIWGRDEVGAVITSTGRATPAWRDRPVSDTWVMPSSDMD